VVVGVASKAMVVGDETGQRRAVAMGSVRSKQRRLGAIAVFVTPILAISQAFVPPHVKLSEVSTKNAQPWVRPTFSIQEAPHQPPIRRLSPRLYMAKDQTSVSLNDFVEALRTYV